jgi:hypothetical protein
MMNQLKLIKRRIRLYKLTTKKFMQPHDDEQPRCVTELLKKDYSVAKLDNTLA